MQLSGLIPPQVIPVPGEDMDNACVGPTTTERTSSGGVRAWGECGGRAGGWAMPGSTNMDFRGIVRDCTIILAFCMGTEVDFGGAVQAGGPSEK
jgi:hypothetical protein